LVNKDYNKAKELKKQKKTLDTGALVYNIFIFIRQIKSTAKKTRKQQHTNIRNSNEQL